MRKFLVSGVLALFAIVASAGDGVRIPLTYEMVPAHVTMELRWKDYDTGSIRTMKVVGPSLTTAEGFLGSGVWQAPGDSTSDYGWQIRMVADADYSVPTFSVCPQYDDEANKAEGEEFRSFTTVVPDSSYTVRVYNILTTSYPAEKWVVPLTYEAIPANATVKFTWQDFYTGTECTTNIVGPAAAIDTPFGYATSERGWSIEALAADGYTVVFSVCPFFEKPLKERTLTHASYADVKLDSMDALYLYGMAVTPNRYMVRFNANGGGATDAGARKVTFGTPYGTLPAATRTGYTFKGWYRDDGKRIVASTVLDMASAHMLTAKWEANTYWILFEPNGGTGTMEPVQATYGASAALPSAGFQRVGYAFAGWGTRAEGGVSYGDGATVSSLTQAANGGVRLYAQWEGLPVGLVFDPGAGGTVVPNGCPTNAAGVVCCTATVDQAWCTLPTASNTDASLQFAGWWAKIDGFWIKADGTVPAALAQAAPVTLFAKWTAPVQDLAAALDAPGLAFTTNTQNCVGDGNGFAISATEGATAGTSCLKAGMAYAGVSGRTQTSKITTTLTGPGRLLFKWKILSKPGVGDVSGTYDWYKTSDQFSFQTNYTGQLYLGGTVMVAGLVADETQQWTFTGETSPATVQSVAGPQWVQMDIPIVQPDDATMTVVWAFESYFSSGSKSRSGDAWLDDVKWIPENASRDVTFDANRGTGSMAAQSAVADTDFTLTPNVFTRTEYVFAGWTTPSSDEALLFADGASARLYDDATLKAVWKGADYAIAFNANGGTGAMDAMAAQIGQPTYLTPNQFTREGFDFAGWATSASGASAYDDVAQVVDLGAVTLYALWTEHVYAVGEEMPVSIMVDGVAQTLTLVVGEPWGASLPAAPTPPAGMTFAGWFTQPNGQGVQVTADTVLTPSMKAIYAYFVANSNPDVGGSLYADVKPDASKLAAVYDGLLLDASGRLAGTLQVKLAKFNERKGLAKVTATVTVLGEKKISLKGGEWRADSSSVTLTAKDGRSLTLVLGARGMAGSFGNYAVDGAVNLFSSKQASDKADGAARLAPVQGVYTLAYPEADGWNSFSITVASKGKAKIKGTLADGTKVSLSTQLLIGETSSCVPIAFAKKAARAAAVLWIGADRGTTQAEGADGIVASALEGGLANGSKFMLDVAGLAQLLPADVQTVYLPDGVAVEQSGTKWIVAGGAKAGKVALVKGSATEIDTAKTGENPSALKLSYAPKTGLFKGTFKAYSNVGGKIKSKSVTVTGALVGDVGYGAAMVKKVGGVPVKVSAVP